MTDTTSPLPLPHDVPADADPILAGKVLRGEDITAEDITRALCPVCAGFTPEVVARNTCTHSARPYPYVRA